MNCCATIDEEDLSEFAEVDPSGRYGRYNEILGRGSSKTVYKAFDEYEGIEVAWNQVKLHDFMRNPEDLEKLYREIHLLKTLKHENIMKFYTSWVDTASMTINFVTELFNSGTLRQYRLKHKRVNIRAVKNWCRQILKGLLYLHSHDPPIIHRDLKCDNIFINGNQGEVKIGDLGLAAILRKSHAVRCVGTPEFMAPEVYEEEYNELVDIYSFGMCVLEMVTFEYPYSECTHPAQIYKKVISRKKPEAFYRVKDPEVRRFINNCLTAASSRLPAFELLKDPFLQVDDNGFDLRPVDYYNEYNEATPFLRQPTYGAHHNNVMLNGDYEYPSFDDEEGNSYQDQLALQMSEIDLFANQDDENYEDVDISIKGRKKDDDGIFLRLRIADKEGRIRNIYFPFNTKTDTALSVAAEMVSELDITDQDVAKIAEMIDGEISTLVPDWLKEETALETSRCASNSLDTTISSNCKAAEKSHTGECPKHEFGSSVHGRFEEITYQVDQCAGENSHQEETPQCKNKGILFADIWAQRENADLLSDASKDVVHQDETCNAESVEKVKPNIDSIRHKRSKNGSMGFDVSDGYENEIRQELRQLKERYQLQLMDPRPFNSIDLSSSKSLIPLALSPKNRGNFGYPKKLSSGKQWTLPFSDQSVQDCEESKRSKGFVNGDLPPRPLHRAVSLPVDAAIDV